ncbi:OmpA family protein [Acetobacteraceae bacterium H6797]|nr:OmpA family protein [Acetobacteraceae bacterium H6797]
MRPAFAAFALMAMLAAGCAMRPPVSELPPRIVFFSEDSSGLDESAAAVVSDAAALAKEYPNAPVRVLGYADPDGGPDYNKALSRARAERVATMLKEKGVAAERITIGARGPVPFELAPIESRRVEIKLGN